MRWTIARHTLAVLLPGIAAMLPGCAKSGDAIALSRHDDDSIPDVPVPAADGPKLGAISHTTPIRRRPAREARVIGYLHAGAKVARAAEPFSKEDCSAGWYPIRPRGFVCLDEGATLDLHHPTLVTMAIQPNLDEPLPYAYARTLQDTPLYEVDEQRDRGVRPLDNITSKSGLAVVGSWEATDPDGQTHRLAMMTNGRFVDTDKLKEAKVSSFHGVTLNAEAQLPIAFVVKRGVYQWKLTGPTLDRGRELEKHELLVLTGTFRTVREEKFWELPDGMWVRHRDVTTVRQRETFPQFVTEQRKWLDVSIITGTAVAYEGQTPVYATLVSVGKDRLGEELENPRVTQRGEFEVVAKHITALNANVRGFANRVDMYDTPWTIELSSGQLVHGTFWHNRFGIEHGPGNIQLSPADARWLWSWIEPEVPQGWHAVTDFDATNRSMLNVRK